MNKKISWISTIITLVVTIATFIVLLVTGGDFERTEHGIVYNRTSNTSISTYYGCPNSKRIKKLNLNKNRR